MSLRVVVLAAAHLVRQPVAQSLAALDFAVTESSDLAEVVGRLNDLAPDLIVMDADGMARQWRALAAGLGGARTNVGLVLLAGRFSFEDAHDAQALRVAAVIIKPYRREEHAVRLLDVALARRGLRALRAAPRLPMSPETGATLLLPLPNGERAFPLVNLSEGGAAVRLDPAASAAFRPGEFFPAGMLGWGDVRVDLACDVVHCAAEAAGLSFSRIFDGRAKLDRALGERFERALGSLERKRRW